jgi:hypothetical protein
MLTKVVEHKIVRNNLLKKKGQKRFAYAGIRTGITSFTGQGLTNLANQSTCKIKLILINIFMQQFC